MYAFIPAFIFLGAGIWLYRVEWKKEPEFRSKANIMLASYACILGVALMIVSILYWGQV
jgi:hypothetical protein